MRHISGEGDLCHGLGLVGAGDGEGAARIFEVLDRGLQQMGCNLAAFRDDFLGRLVDCCAPDRP